MHLQNHSAFWRFFCQRIKYPYHRNLYYIRRLTQKLTDLSADELIWLARKRMTATRYRVSDSFVEDLKSSLTLTGMSSCALSHLGLVASSTSIDGYAPDIDKIVSEFHLLVDTTGNCIIRTAVDAPEGLLDEKEMPITVVAADLAASLNVRERRSGLDYLEKSLSGIS